MSNVTGLVELAAAAVATRPAMVRAPTPIAPARNAWRRVIWLRFICCPTSSSWLRIIRVIRRSVKEHCVLDIPPQLNKRVVTYPVVEAAWHVDDERQVDCRALDTRPRH